MAKNALLRWIAEAEARSVRELVSVQRALSEPRVAVAAARAKPPRFDGLRRLGWRSGNAAAGSGPFDSEGCLESEPARGASEDDSYDEEEPDRMIVTLLITDIVASTRRVAEIGDEAWHRLLGRHDDITRRTVEWYRGKEVKNRGDGFLAVFDSPTRAVRCASAIAEGVAPLGMALRCGVHTGEIQLECDEIGGLAVHIAARIASLADPGEVLVSQTVRDLVAGSRLVFTDRGTRLLRGVPDEMRLFAMPTTRDAGEARVIPLSQLRRA